MKVINIYGCCVCRDIFRLNPCEDRYRVSKFVQGITPISAFDTKEQRISIEDLSSLSYTNFAKRNITLNINGTAVDYFKEEIADFFILDFADFRVDTFKLTFKDKSTKLITNIKKDVEDLLLQNGVTIEKNIPLSDEEIFKSIDMLIDFLNKDYKPQQIILIENYLTDRHLDEKSQSFRESNTVYGNNKNKLLKRCYEYFIKNLPGINVIKMPDYTLGDTSHKWGFDSLHFIEDYYKYLFKAFEIVVENSPNKQNKLDDLRNLYSEFFRVYLLSKQLEYFVSSEKNNNILKNPTFFNFNNEHFCWSLKCSKDSSFDKETKILKTGNNENTYAILSQEIDLDKIKGRPFNLSIKYRSAKESVFNIVLRYKELVNNEYKMIYAFPKPLISNGLVKIDNIVNIFPSNIDNIKDIEVAIYLNKPNMQTEIFEISLILYNINSPLY